MEEKREYLKSIREMNLIFLKIDFLENIKENNSDFFGKGDLFNLDLIFKKIFEIQEDIMRNALINEFNENQDFENYNFLIKNNYLDIMKNYYNNIFLCVSNMLNIPMRNYICSETNYYDFNNIFNNSEISKNILSFHETKYLLKCLHHEKNELQIIKGRIEILEEIQKEILILTNQLANEISNFNITLKKIENDIETKEIKNSEKIINLLKYFFNYFNFID